MASPASIERRPIHPMLVIFPAALLLWSVVCEFWWRGSGNWFWYKTAWYSMAAGIIGGVVAAVPGFIDYMSIRDRRIFRLATWHMVLNLSVVTLFTISFFLRLSIAHQSMAPIGPMPAKYNAAFVLSLIGAGLLFISAPIGWTMVYVHSMAVDCTEACERAGHIRAAQAPAD